MATRFQRKSGTRRLLETVFLIAGVVGLSVWGWSVVSESLYEDWHNWSFDRQMQGKPADMMAFFKEKLGRSDGAVESQAESPAESQRQPETASPIPQQADNAVAPPRVPEGLVGRLSIPRLNVRAVVREGTGERTLSLALGHIAGTALPGQNGNVGVAGHRDALFRGLRNVRQNDRIIFETPTGDTFEYLVKSTQIVKPSQVSVLNAGLYPELTLVTCYPFNYVGSAPDRFIVKARQVSQVSKGQSAPEVAQMKPAESTPASTQEPPPPPETVTPVRERPRPLGPRRIPFEIATNHSRNLGQGISIGLTNTDELRGTASGWMWIMPEKRTIWLRDVSAKQPVSFYRADGRHPEVVVSSISRNSVRGYLVLPEPSTLARAAGE